MPFNKLFDIPSFPDITLSLFQALFSTGCRWYDGWFLSQRLGKSCIASMKVSLSKGSTFCLLVASSFLNKQNDHSYLQNIQGRNEKPDKRLRFWRLKASKFFRKKLHLRCLTGFTNLYFMQKQPLRTFLQIAVTKKVSKKHFKNTYREVHFLVELLAVGLQFYYK